MAKIPKSPFEKVLKESGKNIRVSDSATKVFVDVIEDIAKELGADAAELARHAGRKTILEADVRLAAKRRK